MVFLYICLCLALCVNLMIAIKLFDWNQLDLIDVPNWALMANLMAAIGAFFAVAGLVQF